MPRRAANRPRFVEQIDIGGEVRILQQREVPEYRAVDDDDRQGPPDREAGGPYCQLFLNQLPRLDALSKSERTLFDLILTKMRYHDPIYLSPSELADEVGFDQRRVYRALAVLRERELIIRITGPRHLIDPRVAWQGAARSRNLTIAHLTDEGLLTPQTAPVIHN